MRNITGEILELIRLTSTDLPPSVEQRLQDALNNEEEGSAARGALETILKNISIARKNGSPICQDTGTPIFHVQHPANWTQRELTAQIRTAVAEATQFSYLRPNAVDSLSGRNSGNNLGEAHFPSLYFTETETDILTIDLILKGGGCENVGTQYSLPDTRFQAGRDLEGVRKVVLDAVWRAQGEGCAPGFLGIAIGGDRGTSFLASKEALMRPVEDTNPDQNLQDLEERILREANQLGIGPMGFGGKTTILGTKINALHRLPACFFVSVSYMCWAYRHRTMTLKENQVLYM